MNVTASSSISYTPFAVSGAVVSLKSMYWESLAMRNGTSLPTSSPIASMMLFTPVTALPSTSTITSPLSKEVCMKEASLVQTLAARAVLYYL